MMHLCLSGTAKHPPSWTREAANKNKVKGHDWWRPQRLQARLRQGAGWRTVKIQARGSGTALKHLLTDAVKSSSLVSVTSGRVAPERSAGENNRHRPPRCIRKQRRCKRPAGFFPQRSCNCPSGCVEVEKLGVANEGKQARP